MRNPDVIGIGTRRCGSSWLHQVLDAHSEIGKPENGLHFFSDAYARGADWYLKELSSHAGRKLLLEYSVSYLYPDHAETAAKRIAEMAPEVRLFATVRDPVARAFSDYLRALRFGDLPAGIDFETAIEDAPELIERGRYATLLGPYLDRFGPERVKILFYDDLETDSAGYFADLADYLEISPELPGDVLARRDPVGRAPRSARLAGLVRGTKEVVDTFFERVGFGDQWSNWKGRHVYRYQRALELNEAPRRIPIEIEKRLREQLGSEIEALARLTGRNLEHWHVG